MSDLETLINPGTKAHVTVKVNTPQEVVETLLATFEKRGFEAYFEDVTLAQHSLQCATLAESNGETPQLISACLLHDYAHMLYTEADWKKADMLHEKIGHDFLSRWFTDDVTKPVLLHVPAKRCLVTVDSKYFDLLSKASVYSLEMQGGPFSKREAEEFQKKPFAADAMKLRRYDDMAKMPNYKTPPLEHFKVYMLQSISTTSFNQ
mmetsp:Transcript_15709/g.17461  ORF Transcript_15709/g.17461 Transcript_15709/m.17461 type:complete len:206 (-) Transcript_15709:98-715(-)